MPQRHPALVFMCYFSAKKMEKWKFYRKIHWKSGNFQKDKAAFVLVDT